MDMKAQSGMKPMQHKNEARGAIRLLLGMMLAAFCAFMPFHAPAFAQDAAELLLRMDRLEAENRRLNGQVEEMRFQLRRLEDQSKRFQTDVDFRFRDLEQGKSGARPPAAASPPAQRRSDAFEPEANPNAAGAPRPLAPPAANAPLDVSSPRAPVATTPPAAATGDAKSDFDFARSLIERNDYELAEGAFREFLRVHAKDRRVPEATFWLGESYLRRTRHREAAEQFLTVTTKYGNSTRAPEAMLKLGVSLQGLGAKQEACATFSQVASKYPKAPPNVLQSAQRERVRAQC
jgi:tol-pal system protein YbgF